jgi:sulfur-oxidizing protein SoxX
MEKDMRTLVMICVACVAAGGVWLSAQATDSPSAVEAVLEAAFPEASDDFKPRLSQDETMAACSRSLNAPDAATAQAIAAAARDSVVYPADGRLMGDWQNGEKLAQSGYGMRFTDYPPAREVGGNCYACHQLTREEVSYGTLGPSLLGYGKARGDAPDAIKAAYEKIYNPHIALPCSTMPRFGANGVLNVDQIKDLVALLMDPASPVNK